MKKLFLSTLLLALPLLASAYDIAVENEDGVTIYYNYINNGKELEVTNNNGWGNSYSGIILIPEEVTYKNVTRKVTSVGEYAFKDCEKTISVTLPNSVITISPYAFIGCTGLISITMGEGISFIGYKAFSNCTNLSSVAIPNCVVTLGNSSFADCGSLSSITIGNSVTTIGGSAFLNCNSLTSISIPNSVKEIEMYAFSGCSGLTSIISEIENPCPISETCFSEEIFNNTLLYVPKGTTEKYKSTDYWNKFLHIIEGSPFEHTLTYLVDGETYSTYTLEEGDEITPDEAPTKEGYTFSGWSEIPETMPASDFTITGSFTINKYKLTYTLDGEEYKTVEVDYGTAITPEEAPVKEGYTFSGWSVIPATMPAGDVTITGSFSVNKYNLTYKVDGVDYKTAQIEFGSPITSEAIPTKEGYTFSGWSDIPESMPANDVTVTGTFTINKYKLTYMVDGAEYKSSEVNFGIAITAEAIPVKEGYTFSGWSEIPSTMPASDVTISGTFTINKYKLTYTVDGKVFKSSEVEFGSTITAEDNPTKEGYTFSGWSEIPETMPASDVTIIGSFTVNKYNLTYKVDGVDYKTTQIEYGSAITPEAIPTKEGYTFSGWSDIPETMPASDVTITGTFNINKYKLTYMVDGIEYKSYEVEFGATITPEASPANEGQIFSGWSEIPTTMPAQDVVITGTFSDNSYKLTYMVDGEVFKSSHVEYGSTITPETPPTKEGYTFSGWSEIPTTMPASDVTVSGTFTINTYMITYMVDNALLTTEEVTYGSTITPPASPKEGYEITWNSHPTTMPAYDVTIYGSYISTGINGIYAEESDKKVYTPDGKRVQSPKKGMNIIRMSDGTLKKVVVK